MTLDSKLLEHHKEAERKFCAAVFLDPDYAKQQCGWLDSSLFYDTRMRKFWQSIKDGVDRSDAAMDASVYGVLLGESTLIVSSGEADSFANTISKDHFFVAVANGLSTMANALADRNEVVLRDTLKKLSDVSPIVGADKYTKTAIEIGLEFNESLFDKQDILRLGMGSLDTAIGGLRKKTITILAGATSMGKSTSAIQICRNVVSQGKKIIYFALEQSHEELWLKMACGDLGYDYRKINLGTSTDAELQKVGAKTGELIGQFEKNLIINDKSGITSNEIWQIVARERPDLFVVDHLGLVRHKEQNIVHRLGYVTSEGKEIAKEMNCAAIYVCQINRSVANRDIKQPTLADLRDSGNIENNADIVLFIYSKDYYEHPNKPINERRPTRFIVAKNRNGISGVEAELDFIPRRQRFYGKDEREGE